MTWFAQTEASSPVDQELWVGIAVNERGKLWINDRLVWTSADGGSDRAERREGILRARFRRGRNSLTVRIDNTGGESDFALRICTRGRPRSGEDAEARRRAVAKAQPRQHLPTNVRGWRNDWTGRYPDATPCTAFDVDRGINVLWRTPLVLGNSTPVVVGGRLFTQEEPHALVCLDKHTGTVLWKRDSNVLELIGKDDLLGEYEKLRDAWHRAEREFDRIGGRRRAAAVLRTFGLSDQHARARIGSLEAAGAAFWNFVWKHTPARKLTWGVHMYGYAFPTPVTDGKHIWVKFGTGVVACYALDGERRWMTAVPCHSRAHQVCPSPVLVGGRLIVECPADPGGRGADVTVWCLDAACGRKLWEAPAQNTHHSSTPVPMRLTNGLEGLDVVVVNGRTVIRVDDGKVLCDTGVDGSYDGPVAAGDVLYIRPDFRAVAVQLVMLDRDTVGCRRLWDRPCSQRSNPGGRSPIPLHGERSPIPLHRDWSLDWSLAGPCGTGCCTGTGRACGARRSTSRTPPPASGFARCCIRSSIRGGGCTCR